MRWSALCLTLFLRLSSTITAGVRLELETNGPVYYKAPLAITGHLIGAPRREYKWTFRTRLPNGAYEETLTREDRAMINETFNVNVNQTEEYKMAVRVTYTPFLWAETIAFEEINFVLTNKIPVVVEFMQNGTLLKPENGVLTVSSAEIVNATTRVNDPSGYFQQNGMQMTTQWGLNNDIRLRNSSFARLYPSAPDRIQDTLQMFMTVDDFNNTYIADGSVSTVIKAIDPVLSLNLTNKLTFQRGNLTHLELTCNASTPIFYCVVYAPLTTNISQINCSDYVRRDVCQISLTHYFGAVGNHEVMIAVRNTVNDILHWDDYRSIYSVLIYDVPTKGLLRLFVVPISCVILGTIVAASGYALYEHTKGDMRVETADFDFAGNSNREDLDATLVERTFWTHLRDELAESSPIFHWLTRKPPQQPSGFIEESSDPEDDSTFPEP